MYILPDVTLSRPPIAFNNVVFPHPDGPSKATNPVLSNFKEVLLITWISFFLYLL